MNGGKGPPMQTGSVLCVLCHLDYKLNVVFKEGETLCHPWCWTIHYFKLRQTALPKPWESVSTGALPLLGLRHSATGGGFLADLPSVACFCINREDSSGEWRDVAAELQQAGYKVSGVGLLSSQMPGYSRRISFLADKEDDLFTLAPREISPQAYVEREPSTRLTENFITAVEKKSPGDDLHC